jgi:GTP diphosphokinase / guanosine-3',5'-bis(diphosphate) 3'-diphosphatase
MTPSTGKHKKSITPANTDEAATVSFAQLTAKLNYLNSAHISQIKLAYRFSDQAHLGQMRKSGQPYITHPIAVAALCADWKLDSHALMAALLHDTIEDCNVTKSQLIEHFGPVVADLVDGLTKLDKLQFSNQKESQAESFRKMLLAMSKDVRVILIKLADRLHNMRTLSDMPTSKWKRIAEETLEIYAPIAHRLGLNTVYRELQNLGFAHLKPWRYAILKKAVLKARNNRNNLVQTIATVVQEAFTKAKLSVQLQGREKTIYSIYCKMTEKHLNYSEIHDIFGFRILLNNPLDCYTAIGVLHQIYQPIPGKFKDHIAIPKINGYQSLHTIVAGPAGISIEFQTRTHLMHLVAESGLAAHWIYKVKQSEATEMEQLDTEWLKSLLDIQEETIDSGEFWDHVKVDLFPAAVYVFTPKNRILALPRGATVVDFAYAIHSNIGDHAISARINGVPAALRTELHNGEMVEVITSPTSSPNPTWLDFVRTGRARSRIRHYLKTLTETDSAALGEQLLVQSLRAEGISNLPLNSVDSYREIWDKVLHVTGSKSQQELLCDIGLGKRIAGIVAKKLTDLLLGAGEQIDLLAISNSLLSDNTTQQIAFVVDGSENSSVKYATCCRPVPGDDILGYLGKGDGIAIHRKSCPQAQQLLLREQDRFIFVEWSDAPLRTFVCGFYVLYANTMGAIAKIAAIISRQDADIAHIAMEKQNTHSEELVLHILVSVHDKVHLEKILTELCRSHLIKQAYRF